MIVSWFKFDIFGSIKIDESDKSRGFLVKSNMKPHEFFLLNLYLPWSFSANDGHPGSMVDGPKCRSPDGQTLGPGVGQEETSRQSWGFLQGFLRSESLKGPEFSLKWPCKLIFNLWMACTGGINLSIIWGVVFLFHLRMLIHQNHWLCWKSQILIGWNLG